MIIGDELWLVYAYQRPTDTEERMLSVKVRFKQATIPHLVLLAMQRLGSNMKLIHSCTRQRKSLIRVTSEMKNPVQQFCNRKMYCRRMAGIKTDGIGVVIT